MKKLIAFILVLVCVTALVGCNNSTPAEEEVVGSDRRPMVMVDGVLYYDTDRESTAVREDGLLDGKITSEVARSQIPTENNQSNFGAGYGYQFGTEGTIDIYINGKWWVFEAEEIVEEAQTEPTSRPILDCQSLQAACADSFIDPSQVTVLGGEWAYTNDPNKFVALATVRYTTDKNDEYQVADIVMVGTFGCKTELFHHLNEHSPYTRENALQEFGAVDGQRFPLE